MSRTENNEEVTEGEVFTVRFDEQLCIHARFCVMEAPDVFRADARGAWILPRQTRAIGARRGHPQLSIWRVELRNPAAGAR